MSAGPRADPVRPEELWIDALSDDPRLVGIEAASDHAAPERLRDAVDGCHGLEHLGSALHPVLVSRHVRIQGHLTPVAARHDRGSPKPEERQVVHSAALPLEVDHVRPNAEKRQRSCRSGGRGPGLAHASAGAASATEGG